MGKGENPKQYKAGRDQGEEEPGNIRAYPERIWGSIGESCTSDWKLNQARNGSRWRPRGVNEWMEEENGGKKGQGC